MTITGFMEARLAEEKAAADAATPGPWKATGQADAFVEAGNGGLILVGEMESDRRKADAAHIALHNPDRALCDIEADQTLLSRYELLQHPRGLRERLLFPSLAEVILACIRDRAAVRDAHPDYDEKWQP